MAAKTVTDYINDTSCPVKETLQATRQLILETLPDVEEYMKWGVPTFSLPQHPPICYLYGGKDHVNVGFLLGTQLDDPEGLLQGEGKKDSRHVRLTSQEPAKWAAIRKFLQDSAKLA